MLREGEREEEMNFTAQEITRIPNLGEAFRRKGSQGGTLGTFPGIRSPREGHPVRTQWLL